jgi:hypothetical protein
MSRDTSDCISLARTSPHGHSLLWETGKCSFFSQWPYAKLKLLILLAWEKEKKDTMGQGAVSAKLVN